MGHRRVEVCGRVQGLGLAEMPFLTDVSSCNLGSLTAAVATSRSIYFATEAYV